MTQSFRWIYSLEAQPGKPLQNMVGNTRVAPSQRLVEVNAVSCTAQLIVPRNTGTMVINAYVLGKYQRRKLRASLVAFKRHACATNEIFLLVADVFARICCEVDSAKANGVQFSAAVDTTMSPFCSLCKRLVVGCGIL